MDSRRLGRHYASREYTLARTIEVYSTYYDVKYPGHERRAGRPLRLSPTYARLAELGAVFGEKSGWERANWFEPNAAAGDEGLRPRGWAGRLWSPAIGAEHRARREAAAGRVPCLAVRVTYVGELGWELYCPTEFGLGLWDTLWEAGLTHGLVAGGYKAIDSLRLEKGYRVWGADITPEDTPHEAGLGFAAQLEKDFVGKDALPGAEP